MEGEGEKGRAEGGNREMGREQEEGEEKEERERREKIRWLIGDKQNPPHGVAMPLPMLPH